ncbi:3-dehydroquinate synthase [Desulfuribacillus alkaliarsenatis]|uniref:3-dehydroquinate synthase n=1 Tax=Desulfuribacillus alkaliarsenatis TaxID=766136 RepID=A0A1E5G6R3_9FIRM|nr:3-dehydroquinate synthase [Desulfuribacillus alkaliarsenatis]
MFHTINLHTSSSSYDIIFGEELLENIHLIKAIKNIKPTKVLVLSDTVVGPLYANTMLQSLKQMDIDCQLYTVPSGENSKSLAVFQEVVGYMLEQGFDRKSLIIALGGGVVGDLGGFVAASFMRGIPFVQVPTTILAHDSSVGGKVAINHPLGKNTIGAFHQPLAVVYDMNTIKTLPKEQIASGVAEIVKHAHIHRPELNHWLIENYHKIEQLDNKSLATMLYKSCEVKAEIVSKDERETGVRAYLNFGHTIAHGIEGALGYGKIPHGIAVAIGMVSAALIGYQKGITPKHVLTHIIEINKALKLPIHLPESIDEQNVINYILHDKKNIGGQLTFVLLEELGKPAIIRGITTSEVLDALQQQKQL